jgi:hypothetical protein
MLFLWLFTPISTILSLVMLVVSILRGDFDVPGSWW